MKVDFVVFGIVYGNLEFITKKKVLIVNWIGKRTTFVIFTNYFIMFKLHQNTYISRKIKTKRPIVITNPIKIKSKYENQPARAKIKTNAARTKPSAGNEIQNSI